MVMKCPFCKPDKILKIKKKHVDSHLIVTRDSDLHFHVHGPISNKYLMERFIKHIAKESGIVVRDRAESVEEESSESPEQEDSI